MDLSWPTLRLSVCQKTLNIQLTTVKFGRRRPTSMMPWTSLSHDPLLVPPPLYDHQDAVVEDKVKKVKDPRREQGLFRR
eukprot:4477691-Amphidinium_carterae.1